MVDGVLFSIPALIAVIVAVHRTPFTSLCSRTMDFFFFFNLAGKQHSVLAVFDHP